IQVTNAGTAKQGQSARSFTVGCGAPVVTDVTTALGAACSTHPVGAPGTVGTSGTAVTVVGSNFATTPDGDRVLFNNHYAAVGPPNPTATQIYTAVPADGTSGKITVRTAKGAATSPCDFLVPPSGYTVAQVDAAHSSRMPNPSNAGSAGSITVGSDSLV